MMANLYIVVMGCCEKYSLVNYSLSYFLDDLERDLHTYIYFAKDVHVLRDIVMVNATYSTGNIIIRRHACTFYDIVSILHHDTILRIYYTHFKSNYLENTKWSATWN